MQAAHGRYQIRGKLFKKVEARFVKLVTLQSIEAIPSQIKNVYGAQRSTKGLIPWIKLNDYVVEDSQICVEYLTKVFNKDLNSHLTQEQRALGRCILKANEESLKW